MEAGQTCLEMKQRISEVINVSIDEFKIMKSGIKLEEIKDLSQTIYEAGLYKNTKVFVELGKPMNPGSETVLIYEANFNHTEDNELFLYSDLLFELSIGKDISVREFKSIIAKEYSKKMRESNENYTELHRDQIRIRDKGFDRLGKIYRDGKTVKDYGICQNKAIAIQVLDYEESISDDKDVMLVIREWLPGDNGGSLTQKKEILLNRKMKYHEVAEALRNTGFIPENVPSEEYEI